jgi:hypothetical protein
MDQDVTTGRAVERFSGPHALGLGLRRDLLLALGAGNAVSHAHPEHGLPHLDHVSMLELHLDVLNQTFVGPRGLPPILGPVHANAVQAAEISNHADRRIDLQKEMVSGDIRV